MRSRTPFRRAASIAILGVRRRRFRIVIGNAWPLLAAFMPHPHRPLRGGKLAGQSARHDDIALGMPLSRSHVASIQGAWHLDTVSGSAAPRGCGCRDAACCVLVPVVKACQWTRTQQAASLQGTPFRRAASIAILGVRRRRFRIVIGNACPLLAAFMPHPHRPLGGGKLAGQSARHDDIALGMPLSRTHAASNQSAWHFAPLDPTCRSRAPGRCGRRPQRVRPDQWQFPCRRAWPAGQGSSAATRPAGRAP